MTQEDVKLTILSIVATIVEKPMPTPQAHLWLALQRGGALGSDIDDWYTVLRVGHDMGVWTHTRATIELTGKGREVADWVNAEIEER